MRRCGVKYVNIWTDSEIFRLQKQGGISRVWRELLCELEHGMPDATFNPNQRPDVFLSSYYARAPLGVPSVVVAWDFIAERSPLIGAQHVDAVAKRTAIGEAAAVVAISEWVAADCLRYTGKRATVAYCGGGERFTRALPDEVTEFQKRHNILQPYVLLVGKRGLYKNGRALEQAWRFFQAYQQHMVVVVGGEQEHRPQWNRLELSDADLACAYSGATALVYPSIYEGFGLPVLEALACGCPVVCGNGGSLTEVHGGHAFICDPLIPRSLASALDAALDPSARLHTALAGMQHARQFTWKRFAAGVADAIRSVA